MLPGVSAQAESPTSGGLVVVPASARTRRSRLTGIEQFAQMGVHPFPE
jgi:hypothetical protein